MIVIVVQSSMKYAIILYSPMWLGEELSKDILD